MADEADLAASLQEAALAQSLEKQRAANVTRPEPTGYCLNPLCCDDLEGDRLFCGPECANEYERYNRK